MPVNASPIYYRAEEEFHKARTVQEKLKALQKMLQLCPKHKGSEGLQSEIKQKIAKYKRITEKEKAQKKKGFQISVKKEGAATVMIIGTTNSGKSTLLKKITNAKPLIASYKFTTKKPIVGIMNYDGVSIQVVEIPAVVKNYVEAENGATFLGIIRQADLLVILGNSKLVLKELMSNDISKDYVLYKDEENIKDLIWNRLGIIRVYTKQPRKKPSKLPIALERRDCIEDMAIHIHKDFIKKFKFARVWGKSAKHDGMRVGISHKLKDKDIVELHMG